MASSKAELWANIGVRKPAASPSPRAIQLGLVPCPYEGDILERCTSCGGGDGHHVRACAIHGECTRFPTADKRVHVCRGCSSNPNTKKDNKPKVLLPQFEDKFKWISTEQLIRDSIILSSAVPKNAAGIVGIPRSGMPSAGVIATHLHLPLFTVDHKGLQSLSAGFRGNTLVRQTGPLFVVDDTVYGGHSMSRIRSILEERYTCIFAAVYARQEALSCVSVAARLLPAPHLLEWNMLNNGPVAGFAAESAGGVYGSGVAVDMDGILCHDAESGGILGTPYLPARQQVLPLIITGRKESTRKGTEAWLAEHGIRFKRLEMLPDSEPFTAESAALHKARHYSESTCGFYVESCPYQAQIIFEKTKKPVICPIIDKVFY